MKAQYKIMELVKTPVQGEASWQDGFVTKPIGDRYSSDYLDWSDSEEDAFDEFKNSHLYERFKFSLLTVVKRILIE